MNILIEINKILSSLNISVETGVFSGKAPDEYVVITPLADTFALHADNQPQRDTQEARLSLYVKGNYLKRKNTIIKALLAADFTITLRQYIGYEPDTGYYHYTIDVAHDFELGD